ncbi:TadE/TadG family type IV pilus assembly protein [Halalkalibacter alkaliphilus]|uniref:Pilus assembly protein n=1 Tax=Halalkalibacter alkaliphilus TaxID=2917993 RepID=A0A9X2I5D3_9BACI|nr:TadE/TadG family type IV pilus assembly protein [Halalkalibacter alkaliphilus]MCL7748013.1 hypothetical protein [Halalkalibacter alkaliphilus]
MCLQVKRLLTKFKQDNKGSFTLEASLVFPIIFIITIALILFSLYFYDKVVLYQRAHVIAERLASTWDNSLKDFETGDFAPYEYTSMRGYNNDGLYWRTNRIGASLLERMGMELDSVEGVKIANAQTNAEQLIPGARVTITPPANIGFNRKVTVKLERDLNLPQFVGLIAKSEVEAVASASVKDPVELIRTTDFIYHYAEEVQNYIK